MIKIFLINILVLFLIGNLWSDESTKVILTNKSNNSQLKTGETIDVEIDFLPIEKLEKFKIENFNNKRIFEHFFMSNIKLFQVSENNPEVFSIHAKLTLLTEPKDNNEFFFDSGNLKIPVELRNIQIVKTNFTKVDKFILVDQIVSPVIPWKIILTLTLIGLLLVYFVFRKINSRRKHNLILKIERDKTSQNLKLWNEKFLNAKIRIDFEEIFAKKNIWKSLKNSENNKIDEFLKCIERHQYKPSWGESEYREINSYFIHIKNLFKE